MAMGGRVARDGRVTVLAALLVALGAVIAAAGTTLIAAPIAAEVLRVWRDLED